MKPTENDLKAAKVIVNQCTVGNQHGLLLASPETLISHMAFAIATERERAAKDGIEAALVELREMLPNHQASITHQASDVIHGIRGCGQTRQIENLFTVKLWPYQAFTASALSAVMAQVRKWKEESK